MKQNQKGFTLIELLAVIVILAIIALIATPIILNVVNNSRKGAARDSAFGVIKAVQLGYTEALAQGGNIPSEITVTWASNGTTTITPDTDDTKKISINLSGTEVSGGTVEIKDGNATATDLHIDGWYCNTSGNDIVCTETAQSSSTNPEG